MNHIAQTMPSTIPPLHLHCNSSQWTSATHKTVSLLSVPHAHTLGTHNVISCLIWMVARFSFHSQRERSEKLLGYFASSILK